LHTRQASKLNIGVPTGIGRDSSVSQSFDLLPFIKFTTLNNDFMLNAFKEDIFVTMSLPLRITFNDHDFVFHVLTKGITKDTREISITLEGKEIHLLLNEKNIWQESNPNVENSPELLKAIGRAIALRYRI